MNTPFPKKEQQTVLSTSLTERLKWPAERPRDPSATLRASFNRTYRQLLALPRQMRRRFQRQFGLSLAGLALTLALSGTPVASLTHASNAAAPQATIDVTISTPDVNNDGQCSLIEAIMNANGDDQSGSTDCVAGSGADTINLVANSTHTLTVRNNNTDGHNGLPSITSEITIEGNGATIERDSGAPRFRLFHVASTGNLTLNQSIIQGGDLLDEGGGIFNNGTTTINNSEIRASESNSDGGGIHNSGTLTLQDSALSENS